LADALGAVLTRETGGTKIGGKIRDILHDTAHDELDDKAEVLLIAADRAQHLHEVVRPALDAGSHVVSDRSAFSSLAYQGYGRGISLDFIQKLTDLVCHPFRPDVTFLLDIEPEVGLDRARARNHKRTENEGRFEAEDLEFYNRVRDGYLELASADERIQLIYADRPIEAVHRHILTLLGFD